MRCDRHIESGAYVLGALDEDDASSFEEHLLTCKVCPGELDELLGVEAALAEFASEMPAGQRADLLLAPPEPHLLDGLLDEVRSRRRASRRRRLFLVAAAVILVVGGPLATAAIVPGPSKPAGPAISAEASAASNGVRAKVAMTDASWGTGVGVTLSGVRGPLWCELVAVSHDGATQTTATWAVPAADSGASGKAKPFTVWGGTAFSRSQIDHFDVRTLNGKTLVSVKA